MSVERGQQWMTIETAPKGGKWVLLAWPAITDVPFTGYCVEGDWYGFDGARWPNLPGPTHWMPLPELPERRSGEP